MTSKLLKVFLLLAMLVIVVVNADGNATGSSDSGDSTNMIDQCIRKNNCADNDRACRSACAGVPYGGNDVADKTHDCYDQCYNTYLANKTSSNEDVQGYTTCTNKCKSDVYQQGVTEPGSSVPSGSNSNGGNNDNSSSNGQDSGSGSSTDNTTGSENSTSKNDTGAASLTTGAASYVYVFSAIFACVVFGVGL